MTSLHFFGLSRAFALLALIATAAWAGDDETLRPLVGGKAPDSVDEIWSDYDPRREPLEVEVLKEWEEDELVCRIVRYRVGVFKGKKAVVAGIYAFPKGKSKLPGLLQVHGGGQSANLNAATSHARRGYACISLNWGGNPLNNGKYQKIWETPGTDWGAVDGTHPPQRDPLNHFVTNQPNEYTVDNVESPRNSAWFLVTIAARRGLTFLEQQPEVDGDKLGIYGHSMGGKLTVMVAATDSRVKVAVPSCGGTTDHRSEPKTENSRYLPRIACPILFLNPVNDFHGRIDDLPAATGLIASKSFRQSCAANLDHRDRAEHLASALLWFDQHLKGGPPLPESPVCSLEAGSGDEPPVCQVRVDTSRLVESVDVYFTQQLRDEACPSPCWHHVSAVASKSEPNGNATALWSAPVPILSREAPLRFYASVTYALETPAKGAGYYYAPFTATKFSLSSTLAHWKLADVQANIPSVSDAPSLMIETFSGPWQNGWFTYSEQGDWPYRTNKLQDPKWRAPANAKLRLEVRAAEPNQLVLKIDNHALVRELSGGESWQTLTMSPEDFRDVAGAPLADWSKANEFAIGPQETLRKGTESKTLGQPWKGSLPEFKNLQWIRE